MTSWRTNRLGMFALFEAAWFHVPREGVYMGACFWLCACCAGQVIAECSKKKSKKDGMLLRQTRRCFNTLTCASLS